MEQSMTLAGYDSASLAAVVLSATLTVEQHLARPGRSYAPGVCGGCTPQGCPLLTWAERVLDWTRGAR